MTTIEIQEENNDIPVEEIVEDVTDLAETVVEELGDAVETVSEIAEHTCDPHCVEMHERLATLEERMTVTQEHIVAEELKDAITEPEPEPEVEPEPEPEPVASEPEIQTEESTIIAPEDTLIEPPPGRTEKKGPNGIFKALKAIGF